MSSRRPSTDRRRRARAQRGFTVLECEVAVLLLVLVAYGLMRLLSSHEVLLSDMEGLAADESTWYVVQPDAELLRWLGQPATVSAESPGGSAGSNGVGSFGDDYLIEILDASYGIFPLSASAQVELTETL